MYSGLCGAMFFWRLWRRLEHFGCTQLSSRLWNRFYEYSDLNQEKQIQIIYGSALVLNGRLTILRSFMTYQKYSAKHWRLNKLALWLTGRSKSVMSDDDQGFSCPSWS